MRIDEKKREDLEQKVLESENNIAMDSNLQSRKEMADMFERMVSPEYQEERRIHNNRKKFIKNIINKVGL